jgi:hypothetical protein
MKQEVKNGFNNPYRNITYPEVDGVMICMAHCKCGYEVQIFSFRNYGGTRDLQMKWEKHIGTWKEWK